MARVSFVEMMAVCLLAMLSTSSAFVMTPPATTAASLATPTVLPLSNELRTSRRTGRWHRAVLRMSEEDQAVEQPGTVVESAEDPSVDTTASLKSFFAPNTNVRLGASRDQDGKSNVWAVEPSMKVEGQDVETPDGNGLAITGAIVGVLVVVMAATIFSLPSPDAL